MGEVIVRYTNDLPLRVGGVTVEDENGDYNIYLNSRWGYNGQFQTYNHEYRHIKRGDFDSGKAIEDIEGK